MQMPTCAELERMRRIGIEEITRDSLRNVRTIDLDPSLPQTERALRYIEQTGNPYCFLSGDTPVRVRFADTDRTLSQSLLEYFSRLKQS